MHIYLIRHGETEFNVGKPRFRGQTNIPLSEMGIKQAISVSEALKDTPFDVIFYSALDRAKRCAEEIQKNQPHAQMMAESALYAMSYGDWEGHPLDEVFKTPEDLQRWHIRPDSFIIPNGDTFFDALSKLHLFFKKLEIQKYEKIALVTHSTQISLIFCYLFKLDLSHFWEFNVDTCSISVISFKSTDSFRLRKFNLTTHLETLENQK